MFDFLMEFALNCHVEMCLKKFPRVEISFYLFYEFWVSDQNKT